MLYSKATCDSWTATVPKVMWTCATLHLPPNQGDLGLMNSCSVIVASRLSFREPDLNLDGSLICASLSAIPHRPLFSPNQTPQPLSAPMPDAASISADE
jgi:hypothetical protein